MDLTFTLANSPYFLGALLVLLLLVLILRNPTKSFFKFLAKKIKAFKLKRKKKKEKKAKDESKIESRDSKSESDFISKEVVKVVKIEPASKKLVYVYWQRVLFLILGIGVIMSAYFKNLEYFTSKFIAFYDFVFSGTGHNNLTTIIVTLLISVALLVIIRLITLVEKRKNTVYKIIHYVLFSVVVVVSLAVLLESVKILSLINSVIMGIVFVLFGLLIKRKR